tara:strand:+ start:2586 stop:2690 length:105 start_codon:yes stop_codon:yes gene_type:complete
VIYENNRLKIDTEPIIVRKSVKEKPTGYGCPGAI